MSDVTLFHIWPSLCSQKVRLALAEKGVAYEGRVVNIGPPMENYEPWYVRMNPAAVVPTLVHGDRIVTDSLQILRYIDAAFDGPSLMPDDARTRALADALLERIDRLQIRTISYAPRRKILQKLAHAAVGMRVRRLQRLARDNPDLAEAYEAKRADVERWQRDILDPATAAAAREEVRSTLAALEETLVSTSGPFILGERYSLLDVMATTLVARVLMLGKPELLEPHPRARAWYERMKERPSYAGAAIMEHVDKRKIAGIMLPWLLPRLAAAALALGALAVAGRWLATALR